MSVSSPYGYGAVAFRLKPVFTLVGHTEAASGAVTMPAGWQAGDTAVACALNGAASVVPVSDGSWLQAAPPQASGSSAAGLFAKTLTAGDGTVTFTNATAIQVVVLRGTRGSAGIIGSSGSSVAASGSPSLNPLTLTDRSGYSWVLTFLADAAATNTSSQTPSSSVVAIPSSVTSLAAGYLPYAPDFRSNQTVATTWTVPNGYPAFSFTAEVLAPPRVTPAAQAIAQASGAIVILTPAQIAPTAGAVGAAVATVSAPSVLVPVASGVGAALGSLRAAAQLAPSAQALTTVSAAVGYPPPVAPMAQAVAAAALALTAPARLTATGQALAQVTATVTVPATLTASAGAVGAAAATATATVALTASGQAVGLAAATVTTTAALVPAASAVAQVQAVATARALVTAAATAVGQGVAQVAAPVGVTAAATAQAAAAAVATVPAQLTAGAQAVAQAVAALRAPATLAASAQAQAQATATVTAPVLATPALLHGQGYDATVLTDAPKGFWPLNDAPPPGFTPPAGMVGWYAADSLALSDGAAVSSLPDKSASLITLAPSTPGATPPTFRTNQINGLPALVFNGTRDVLLGVNPALTAQPITVFVVFASAGGGNRVWGAQNVRLMQNLTPMIYAGAVIAGSDISINAFHYGTFVVNGASSSVRIDGALSVAGDAGASGPATQFALGASGYGDATDQQWQGSIAECLMFNGVLSGTDVQKVESYLNTKYLAGASVADATGGSAGITAGRVTFGVAGIGDGEAAATFAGNGTRPGAGYVVIPDTAALRAGVAGPSTLEFWTHDNLDSNLNNGAVFGKYNSDTGLGIYVWDGYYSTGEPVGGRDTMTLAPSGWSPGWSHVVCVVDGTNKIVYINGAVANSRAWPGEGPVGDTSNWKIGGWFQGTSGDPNSDRTFAKVAFYDRALTPAQVQAHYSAATGGGVAAAAIAQATATVTAIPAAVLVPTASALTAATAAVKTTAALTASGQAAGLATATVTTAAPLTAVATAVAQTQAVATARPLLSASAVAVAQAVAPVTAPVALTGAAAALAAAQSQVRTIAPLTAAGVAVGQAALTLTVPGVAFLPAPSATAVGQAQALATTTAPLIGAATAISQAIVPLTAGGVAFAPSAQALGAATAKATAPTFLVATAQAPGVATAMVAAPTRLPPPTAQAIAGTTATITTAAPLVSAAQAVAAASATVTSVGVAPVAPSAQATAAAVVALTAPVALSGAASAVAQATALVTAALVTTAVPLTATASAVSAAANFTTAATQLTGGGPYAAMVMADGPAAYWRLGESAGTVATDQLGGHNGAYYSGAPNNLLTDPSFESGVSAFTPFAGTALSQSTAQAHTGSNSMLLTATLPGGGTYGECSAYGFPSNQFPVCPGVAYTLSAWLYLTAAGNSFPAVYIRWRNGLGAQVGQPGGAGTKTLNAWQQITLANQVAPATAAYAEILLLIDGGTVASTPSGYWDDVSFTGKPVTLSQPGMTNDGNKAVLLDGVNGNVTIASPVVFAADFTLEGWSYANSPTSQALTHHQMWGGGGGANGSTRLTARDVGYYWGYTPAGAAGETFTQAAGASNQSQWVHWATVKSGSNATLYRNGVVLATLSGIPAGNCSINSIGAIYSFMGVMDEIAAYGYALTAAQVAQHNAAGHAVFAQAVTQATVAVAVPVPLVATAQAQAQVTATVFAPQALTASAQSLSQATAALTAAAPLTASGQAVAQATAVARTTAPLSPTATAQAQATAVVSAPQAQMLTPTAQAQAQATGAATAAARLTPMATGVAQATSLVTLPATLTATATSRASATTSSTVASRLTATASASAAAAATSTAPAQLTPAALSSTAASLAARAPSLLLPAAQAGAAARAFVIAPATFTASATSRGQARLLITAPATAVLALPLYADVFSNHTYVDVVDPTATITTISPRTSADVEDPSTEVTVILP